MQLILLFNNNCYCIVKGKTGVVINVAHVMTKQGQV